MLFLLLVACISPIPLGRVIVYSIALRKFLKRPQIRVQQNVKVGFLVRHPTFLFLYGGLCSEREGKEGKNTEGSHVSEL